MPFFRWPCQFGGSATGGFWPASIRLFWTFTRVFQLAMSFSTISPASAKPMSKKLSKPSRCRAKPGQTKKVMVKPAIFHRFYRNFCLFSAPSRSTVWIGQRKHRFRLYFCYFLRIIVLPPKRQRSSDLTAAPMPQSLSRRTRPKSSSAGL